MRRRRSGRATLITMGIFILAITIAVLAIRFLPIPAEYQKLVFFLLIPTVSFAGVYLSNKKSNR